MKLCRNGLHDKDLPGERRADGTCMGCRRVALKRYKASEKGRGTEARYRASEKYHARRRRRTAAYAASERGRTYRAQYAVHYRASTAGILADERGYQKRRGAENGL